jgi:hypothetical protein
MAIDDGRIAIWSDRAGSAYTSAHLCGKVRNWLCYFRPLTNCSSFANKNNTITARGPHTPPREPNLVPKIFIDILTAEEPHMTELERKHWWRSQSTAFIMRFNSRTIEALAALRRAGNGAMTVTKPDNLPMAAMLRQRKQPLFPLPRGTVSTHVRHGDKGSEMALHPFEDYLREAERLYLQSPLALRRTMFVSTEDVGVIHEAANNSMNWTAIFSDLPRDNSNGVKQMALADNIPHHHFVQLLMALECDAWVGTLRSNWNQLIAELRCVWVAKCANPYVELDKSDQWRIYM